MRCLFFLCRPCTLRVDPLINWRLLEAAGAKGDEKTTKAAEAPAAAAQQEAHAHGHGHGHGHHHGHAHVVAVGSAMSHAALAERRRSVVEVEQQGDRLLTAGGGAGPGAGTSGVSGGGQLQAASGAGEKHISIQNEQLNDKAVAVISRVESKLKGTDFMDDSATNQHGQSARAGLGAAAALSQLQA